MKRFLLWTILLALGILAAPSRAAAQTLNDDLCACDREYDSCTEGCRSLDSSVERTLCYAGCMEAYAACRAAAWLRHQLPLPRKPGCNGSGSSLGLADDVSTSEDCSDDGDSGFGGGGGGDAGGWGGGLSCHSEYIYIEVDYGDGSGWHVWWEGWATVCGDEM